LVFFFTGFFLAGFALPNRPDFLAVGLGVVVVMTLK
jgi:hypothetical protein